MLCRKVSICTQCKERLALSSDMMFPAAQSRRSEGVEVAGMHWNDLKRSHTLKKLCPLAAKRRDGFHQGSGSI